MEIVTQRRNQVEVLPAVGESRGILMALHGYGQQVAFFHRHFIPLTELGFTVVVPEAPHRFYLEGFSGKIGCSWITRYQRQWDIDETNNYLSAVIATISKDHPNVPWYGLGFSQGGHTLYRYAALAPFHFKRLILWAVDFPIDPIPKANASMVNHVEFVHGDQDPFFTEERKLAFETKLSELAITPPIYHYKGDHRMDRDLLLTLFEKELI